MTSTLDTKTTDDAFLGGRLSLLQPRVGYRAGVDPVLLAAAVPAKSGQSLLDLGCGVGTAMLCLHARVAGLSLTGVEVQSRYADLARENAARNDAVATVYTNDLADLPAGLRAQQFDHVIANPPYFGRDAGTASRDPGRDTAFAGDTTLATWITTAAKRCAPKGTVTIIQKTSRLPELLAAMPATLGSRVVLPLAGRAGRDADRVIVQARQNGRAAFRLLAPLVLHQGGDHGADTPDYTSILSAILMNAAPLPLTS